jgi:hypothetical protein
MREIRLEKFANVVSCDVDRSATPPAEVRRSMEPRKSVSNWGNGLMHKDVVDDSRPNRRWCFAGMDDGLA